MSDLEKSYEPVIDVCDDDFEAQPTVFKVPTKSKRGELPPTPLVMIEHFLMKILLT